MKENTIRFPRVQWSVPLRHTIQASKKVQGKIFRAETDLCLEGATSEGQDMSGCELTTFTMVLTVTIEFKMLVNVTKNYFSGYALAHTGDK